MSWCLTSTFPLAMTSFLPIRCCSSAWIVTMSLPIVELLVDSATPAVDGPVLALLCADPGAQRTKKKRQAAPNESGKNDGEETLIGGEQQRNGLQNRGHFVGSNS